MTVVLVEIDRIRQRRKHEGGEKPKEDDMDYKKKMKEAIKKFMPITVSQYQTTPTAAFTFNPFWINMQSVYSERTKRCNGSGLISRPVH